MRSNTSGRRTRSGYPGVAMSHGAATTRFRIYVQSPLAGPPFDQPETVEIPLAPDDIGPGPSDSRVYVLDAIKDRYPNLHPHVYNWADGRPWGSASHPPAQPGPDGHFDHLEPGTRAFEAASVYASVRFALAVWEKYFAEVGEAPIRWHHKPQRTGVDDRLEINPHSLTNGARAGYGFIEFGVGLITDRFNHTGPLWNNFDVVAHELGHSIVFDRVGFPRNMTPDTKWVGKDNLKDKHNGYFVAFHESAGDLAAIVSALHHDRVIDFLRIHSGGNLGAANVLNAIGELGRHGAIRNVQPNKTLARFRREPISKDNLYEVSLPLTGAVYDVFVDVFNRAQQLMYRRNALIDARDWLGRTLAKAWSHLSPDRLTFRSVRDALIQADSALGGEMGEVIEQRFRKRGIR